LLKLSLGFHASGNEMIRMSKKWRVKVKAVGIVCAEDEEAAMYAFIDGWLDFNDFEFELLGECED